MTKLTSEQKSLDCQLVEMTAEDIEQVALIERSCFSNPWPEESFRHDISNSFAYTLVAKEGRVVLGYLVAYLIAEELQIANIAVRPQYRRRGIGRSLLAKALSEGRRIGCRYAILEVRPSNVAATQLYGKFGFRRVGRRPKYYAAPSEDSLIMGRNLT